MYIPNTSDEESVFGVYIPLPAPYESYIRHKKCSFGNNMADMVLSHITLLPPTRIKHSNADLLLDDIYNITKTYRPFWLILDGVDNFIPVSNVSYLKVTVGSDECKFLHENIFMSKAVCENARFPYHPHVTIADNLDSFHSNALENVFKDFSIAFICRKIYVDILDSKGNSKTINVFNLGN